jgi:hypothetical protein
VDAILRHGWGGDHVRARRITERVHCRRLRRARRTAPPTRT